MSDANPTISLTVELSERDAEQLSTTAMRYFIDEQQDRFAAIDRADNCDLLDHRWRHGCMFWCATASDALLLRAYERASGEDAILVFDDVDLYGGPTGSWVVLSTRPFR